MKLQTAIDAYLRQVAADGRAPATIAQYARHLGVLARWIDPDTQVDAVDHETVATFVIAPEARLRPDGRPKAAQSTNALRTSLRCFWRYCHAAGLTASDPARLLRRAKVPPPPLRYLEEKDVARLLAGIDHPRDRALFGLMAATGIRLGAAVALRVEDVDLVRGEILIATKGGVRDRVYLSRRAAEDLRAWLGPRTTGPLFPARHGGPVCARHVRRRLSGWLARAGLRGSPHTLRHSFATALLRRTGDLAVTQAALTHRSITSTLVYARVDTGRLRAALEG